MTRGTRHRSYTVAVDTNFQSVAREYIDILARKATTATTLVHVVFSLHLVYKKTRHGNVFKGSHADSVERRHICQTSAQNQGYYTGN